jgi:hypothetical protein
MVEIDKTSIIYNTLGWKGSLEPNFSDPFVT